MIAHLAPHTPLILVTLLAVAMAIGWVGGKDHERSSKDDS
jgi:hypothetical protein